MTTSQDARDEAAGLLDPASPGAADRRQLLAYLRQRGCSEAELVAAHRDGRLFGLAGDRILRGSEPAVSVAEAAAQLGHPPEHLHQIWHALGLRRLGDGAVLTVREVDGLGGLMAAADLIGIDVAIGVARVAGIGLARISEAEATAMQQSISGVDLGVTGSETLTAAAWESVAALIPGIGTLLDVAHRRHLVETRLHFEAADVLPGGTGMTFGVGFADLSGFTALSATMTPAELSRFITGFETAAAEVVQEHGGRVVKFLGDAVMFVTAGPSQLGRLALALATDHRAAALGMRVRVGIAHGLGIAHDGDYFGGPVNLAARLVAAAAPGEVLAAPSLASSLTTAGLQVDAAPARTLRGFAEPVSPLRLSATTPYSG